MEKMTEGLIEAAMAHVPFDGWSDATFRAACQDLGLEEGYVRLRLPRGGLDLAVAAHRLGDQRLREALAAGELGAMRFRERVIHAVMLRLELAGDKEAVRRASSLFALPQHAAEGAQLIWGTSDAIWTALGDSAEDLNYYTKRATLSTIYGATVLYWLGDDSPDAAETRAFLERRIAGVMAFEAFKGRLRKSPLTAPLMQLHEKMSRLIQAPSKGK